jgi:hypothetical protein
MVGGASRVIKIELSCKLIYESCPDGYRVFAMELDRTRYLRVAVDCKSGEPTEKIRVRKIQLKAKYDWSREASCPEFLTYLVQGEMHVK